MRGAVRSKAVRLVGVGIAAGALVATATVASGAASRRTHDVVSLRLGYLPNLTHAGDLIGISGGYFRTALGNAATLTATAFNAGPDVVTALFGGQLDAAYLGPSPALTAFTVSHGAYQIVAGEASGGAALVVQRSITSVRQLKGTTLSTPQLGNTQDVSLRVWLKAHGLKTTVVGTGDVTILPQTNSNIVTAFQAGAIAGAWVPEPYVSTLVADGGHVLVDEASLWKGGKFSTTVLLVRKTYLQAHPAVVKALISGELAAIQHLNQNPTNAEAEINAAIKTVTGKQLPSTIMHAALSHVTLTLDPVATSIDADAVNAAKLNFLTSSSVRGLYDITLLNQVLKAAKQPTVSAK